MSMQRRKIRVVRIAIWMLTLLFLYQCWYIFLGGNLRVVIPGKIYRSSQPGGDRIDVLVERYGIRTVLNLRGCCDPYDWYLDEARGTHRNNISHEDLSFSAKQLPSDREIRRLVEILDRTEYPLLVHCYRGVDRTGLVTGIAKLLMSDADLSEARDQLTLLYGHVRIGKTGKMDEFFDLYEDWLTEKNRAHSNARFRHWLLHEYCPGACRAEITRLDGDNSTKDVQEGKASAISVRVTNRSIRPWQFSTTATAGFHLVGYFRNENQEVVHIERAGMVNRTLSPNESIDLKLIIPPMKKGVYSLQIDMLEENHCIFQLAGSEPLDVELRVE